MSQVASDGGSQRRSTRVGKRARTLRARPVTAPSAQDTLSRDFPLYDPAFEHDACGTGFVANVSGARDHRVVERALEALANLAHRGAMDAAAESSDGVGVLTQIPHRLLTRWLTERGLPTTPEGSLVVGMVFLPQTQSEAHHARGIIQSAVARQGMGALGWRETPTQPDALGAAAAQCCPQIEQLLARKPDGMDGDECEWRLFRARKEAEQELATAGLDVYIPSLSCRTIVYKGLLTATTLARFYPDLDDPDYASALALFHQRYSTNTFPSWRLAQPMRLLAHNGEINTIRGNRNWMAARETSFSESRWGADVAWLRPALEAEGSDSTSLDNALELLLRAGRDLPDALTLLMPPAWEGDDRLTPKAQAFFQARAPLMEPWDGPAALAFSDGTLVGAALDRNGLRPLRTALTHDGVLVVASEVGAIDLPEASIAAKGRLGPGQALLLDTARGVIMYDAEIKAMLAQRAPYERWVERSQTPAFALARAHNSSAEGAADDTLAVSELLPRQALFGYSHEDVELIVRPMTRDGAEPLWSMGDDTPLAVLSSQPRTLSSYFKQQFAQVTNPPIDPLREQLVMSLTTYLGARSPLLMGDEPREQLLRLASPALDAGDLRATLATARRLGIAVATISTGYTPSAAKPGRKVTGTAMRRALRDLQRRAVAAVEQGAHVLLLSDQELAAGNAPLPQPLALAATHTALALAGLRWRVSLLVETGAAWDAHQVAL
ncbi:MAG TPA: glutamate synthase central domain-containing protein, partial [Ktedonobacterales bacterium]|nr:glutamate synthase central domain-containing protein [Ktedonobacterales bacterium]